MKKLRAVRGDGQRYESLGNFDDVYKVPFVSNYD